MTELRIVQLGINFAVKDGRNRLGYQSLGGRMKLKDTGRVECLK
jgi:hypothetical protein